MYQRSSKTGCGLLAAAGISLLLVTSASAASAPAPTTKRVDIAFAAVAGSTPVACGTAIPGLGSTGQATQLEDLRFYVSDVQLIRGGGRTVPVRLTASPFSLTRPAGAVTLIDLENGTGACAEEGTKATNAHVRGTVPAGTYTGLRYTVGVPSGLNHTDVAGVPAPLNLAALDWSWQFGRKFLKVETTDPSFIFHLGSTGCTGNPATGKIVRCTSPNRAAVRLTSFDPARQKVALDLKALMAGSDLSGGMGAMGPMARASDMDMTMDSGCHSGPGELACAPPFKALGLAWSDTAGGGAASSARQTAFRAMPR